MKRSKVLVLGLSNAIREAEMYYLSYFLKMDLEQVQIDFATTCEDICLSEEFEQKGSHIYHLPSAKNLFAYQKRLKEILIDGHYDAIHVNMDSAINIIPLRVAYRLDIPRIIAHANNPEPLPPILMILHKINQSKVLKYANTLVASSKEAGNWLFKENANFIELKSAVDLETEKYHLSYRNELRKKYGIEESTYLIGQIGTFCEAKNQEFTISLLKECVSDSLDIHLFLIGEGRMEKKLREKIEALELEPYVTFIPNSKEEKEELRKCYSAIDLLLLPSLTNDFPNSAILAQSHGLAMLLSDKVSQELKLNENVKFLDVDDMASWKKEIESRKLKRTRKIQLLDKGYEVKDNVEILERLYEGKEE